MAKKKKKSKINFKFPAYLLAMMYVLGFGLLYFKNNYNKNILYIGFGLVALLTIIYTVVVLCRMGDKFLILITSMLVTIGVLLLCRINIDFGARQILWIAIGGVMFFIAFAIYYNIRFWEKIWYIYVAIGIVLFMLTLVIGVSSHGSKNWIGIGGRTFQPTEVIKIVYIMFLACHYSGEWQKPFYRIKPKFMTAIVTYIFIVFLVLQRDWGTILVMFSIYIFMIYVYETDWRFLAFNVTAAGVVGFLGFKFLHHIQVRVSVWLNPWEDIAEKGYQITQSLFAIASGGYFGRGLGNGSPSYIPEVHTDFIFSAICEEMGVFGGAAVIILFFILAYRCFKISLTATNLYNKAVGLGVTLMFAIQTFIIIGGVIKFIPLTGITVPFVSYGGTSVVVSFVSLGIMQAISAREERGEKHESE